MCNVGAAKCCAMNCCQHFPCEKTLLLRQKFWSLSFEDHKAYGLNIPRGLHTRGVESGRKFTTMQGSNIYKTTWYQIVGLSRSTNMLYKLDNKRGCWFLPHANKMQVVALTFAILATLRHWLSRPLAGPCYHPSQHLQHRVTSYRNHASIASWAVTLLNGAIEVLPTSLLTSLSPSLLTSLSTTVYFSSKVHPTAIPSYVLPPCCHVSC